VKGEANRSRIEKQAMRSRGSRREGVKKGKRKKRKKKVWSGGVGGSMVMVQEDEEITSGLTEEEEAFVRSWTTVLSAVFASQLGAVLFGVTYVGGDSAHVPGGEDTIGGWRDTGSAQHFADAQDLAWSTESDSEEEGTWAYGLDRDDLVGGG